jgi:hypothetical protein
VTSLSVLEVLDKTSSVLGLLETAWELLNNDLGIIEISDGKRDRMLFSKIDNINMQLVDMNEKINEMGMRSRNPFVNIQTVSVFSRK